MKITDFDVGELIAEGGLGEILSATQRDTGRRVVIKRAKKRDEQTFERTRDEGRLGLRVNGTAFVETLGAFDVDGVPHVVLELIEGVHVADLLRRTGALSHTAVAKLGAEIAGALAVLHIVRDDEDRLLNAIHRDISVRNVMVDVHGRVRVLDLGMAYSTSVDRSASTRQGVFVGTIPYLPPEVFAGLDDTPARDVWSLGVLLLEAALGTQYARAQAGETTKERMARVAQKSVDPFADPTVRALDPRLLRVLKQMLQSKPTDRMDARTVSAELSAVYAGTKPQEELERRVRQARQLPAGVPKPRAEALVSPPTPAPSASRTEPEAPSLDPDGPTLIDPRPRNKPLIAPAAAPRREVPQAMATTRSLPALANCEITPPSVLERWYAARATTTSAEVFTATPPSAPAPEMTPWPTPPLPADFSEELDRTVAIECESSASTAPMLLASVVPAPLRPAPQEKGTSMLVMAFAIVAVVFLALMLLFG